MSGWLLSSTVPRSVVRSRSSLLRLVSHRARYAPASISINGAAAVTTTVTRFISTPPPPSGIPNPSSGIATEKHYRIPQRLRQKVLTASDAVGLVQDGDTVVCSGFVCQGVPEALLQALGERYVQTGHPQNLTAFFGGGPGDWGSRGLSHLGRVSPDINDGKPMLRRTIGSHYGQVPALEKLALEEKVEAWTLPMGSVSRMIRAQATHAPGHTTTVGIGTFIDPDLQGGAVNQAARDSPLHAELVRKINVDFGKDTPPQPHLRYRALPINVAIIRGTTADSRGNLTIEHESLRGDTKIIAMAAKNSGGIVLAQVQRLAQNLPARDVEIPGSLVDAIVVVDEQDHADLHAMSMVTTANPYLTSELVSPQDEIPDMPLDIRKIIARRAFFKMEPDNVVNLGIGLPEGVAGVAAEEGMLEYVTLSTEAGAFGGLPASGHNFGPACNSTSCVEMNQMFDFYDGGGLDVTFLGAAQISPQGDVNVSRLSKDRLTGPGGFIDISQSTGKVVFVLSFTAKGLKIKAEDNQIKIESEGQVKKFMNTIIEKTFSGDEAVKRGQEVLYVTERAVFQRTSRHNVIELIEIAPGVDLQKDILDQMDFEPVISPDLKIMDERIFREGKMNAMKDMFGTLTDRFVYHEDDHVMFLDLFGIMLTTKEDIDWYLNAVRSVLTPYVEKKGPIDLVINMNGFDIRQGFEKYFWEGASAIERDLYKSVRRYTGSAFLRAQFGEMLDTHKWDIDELYDVMDLNKNGLISIKELRTGMSSLLNTRLTPTQIALFAPAPDSSTTEIDRDAFKKGLKKLAKTEKSGAWFEKRFGVPLEDNGK